MPKVRVKVHGYDQSSNSIIVSFASNNAKKSIDDYPRAAYQPTMFNETDPEKILEHIARAGIHTTQVQDREEAFLSNPDNINALNNFIGKEFEYDVDTLISTTKQTVESYIAPENKFSVVDEFLTEIIVK